ncbi:uncharacterized protein LOC129738419 [Uranotaenia lowii]|uniref:uncharacterized protein LOC129738419 n=1 Tax=Uranotaenia lowii TaxID=190385 RepID=UPI002478BBA6|nr:uncharacterized protein LOC129738419 [Uranotaenia lowii]
MSSKQIRHILQLSPIERKQFLDSFDYVMFDCDGVLWTVFESIRGVQHALDALRCAGKTLRYITNNSVRPFASYATQFRSLGIDLRPEDIVHPALSIVRYLKRSHFQGLIYCLATENFKNVLLQAGFDLIDGPTEPMEESFRKIIATVNDKAPVGAVIIDVDFNMNYPKLMRAEFYLKRDPNCLLLAGATDRALHVRPGMNVIGPGDFLDILESATGRSAIILGKPGPQLAEQVISIYGIEDPRRVLFVGDMLRQDIAFGARCGFQRMLVLSGGATVEQMLAEGDQECVPDYYADSVADFAKLIEG